MNINHSTFAEAASGGQWFARWLFLQLRSSVEDGSTDGRRSSRSSRWVPHEWEIVLQDFLRSKNWRALLYDEVFPAVFASCSKPEWCDRLLLSIAERVDGRGPPTALGRGGGSPVWGGVGPAEDTPPQTGDPRPRPRADTFYHPQVGGNEPLRIRITHFLEELAASENHAPPLPKAVGGGAGPASAGSTNFTDLSGMAPAVAGTARQLVLHLRATRSRETSVPPGGVAGVRTLETSSEDDLLVRRELLTRLELQVAASGPIAGTSTEGWGDEEFSNVFLRTGHSRRRWDDWRNTGDGGIAVAGEQEEATTTDGAVDDPLKIRFDTAVRKLGGKGGAEEERGRWGEKVLCGRKGSRVAALRAAMWRSQGEVLMAMAED